MARKEAVSPAMFDVLRGPQTQIEGTICTTVTLIRGFNEFLIEFEQTDTCMVHCDWLQEGKERESTVLWSTVSFAKVRSTPYKKGGWTMGRYCKRAYR